MKSALLPLTFAIGTSAFTFRRDACSFSLLARGGEIGDLGETVGGDITLGGANSETSFYISNGGLMDTTTGACTISSSSRLQCQGTASGETYTVTANETLLYNGCSKFFACDDDESGTLNIFTDGRSNTSACYPITLETVAYNCTALGRSTTTDLPTSTTPPTTISTITGNGVTVTPFTTVSGGMSTETIASRAASCPTDLSSGTFTSPNLLIPISLEDPTIAFGPSANVTIMPANNTLYNFDIPYTGTCALLFFFPFSSSLAAGHPAYLFSGIEEEEGESGGLNFTTLASSFGNNVTYATRPEEVRSFGKTEILPGSAYTIGTFDCEAGDVAVEGSSDGGVDLIYSQSSDPSPLGLFVVPCE